VDLTRLVAYFGLRTGMDFWASCLPFSCDSA
jgi:hypothetical protein